MSISSQITRLNNAKAAIIAAIEAKGVSVPDNATLGALAEYITQTNNADTVDGWHFDVQPDSYTPPSGTTATLTFIYGG